MEDGRRKPKALNTARAIEGPVPTVYYPSERSGFLEGRGFGCFHVYYGAGVGKTTRAVGLAIRAAGQNFHVAFVQFMKAGTSGERRVFDQIPSIRYFCPGEHPFIMPRGPEPVHFRHATAALQFAQESAAGDFQVLICDEILNTLIFNLLAKDQLLDLIDRCRNRIELVFTGRSSPADILNQADYATEMIQVKHPYYQGARARKGIEY